MMDVLLVVPVRFISALLTNQTPLWRKLRLHLILPFWFWTRGNRVIVPYWLIWMAIPTQSCLSKLTLVYMLINHVVYSSRENSMFTEVMKVIVVKLQKSLAVLWNEFGLFPFLFMQGHVLQLLIVCFCALTTLGMEKLVMSQMNQLVHSIRSQKVLKHTKIPGQRQTKVS